MGRRGRRAERASAGRRRHPLARGAALPRELASAKVRPAGRESISNGFCKMRLLVSSGGSHSRPHQWTSSESSSTWNPHGASTMEEICSTIWGEGIRSSIVSLSTARSACVIKKAGLAIDGLWRGEPARGERAPVHQVSCLDQGDGCAWYSKLLDCAADVVVELDLVLLRQRGLAARERRVKLDAAGGCGAA